MRQMPGTSRGREVSEIVNYRRAAVVGQLLLGELNGPLPFITPDTYRDLPRREIKAELSHLRAILRGEIRRFCLTNFEDLSPTDLAKMYEPLYEHGGVWNVPLVEFITRFGRPRRGVLRGAPLHATVCLSPWGLQTESPEHHLVNDIVVAFNTVLRLENKLKVYEGQPWSKAKQPKAKEEIGNFVRGTLASRRFCILACFNLVEAYINGVAWDYVNLHGITSLPQRKRNVFTEEERPVGIVEKLVKVPTVVRGDTHGPLHETRDPLKTFVEVIKPYRDSIVHASPFAVPERFGGYNKLNKLYSLDTVTVIAAVDNTFQLLKVISEYVGPDYFTPHEVLRKEPDGNYVLLQEYPQERIERNLD